MREKSKKGGDATRGQRGKGMRALGQRMRRLMVALVALFLVTSRGQEISLEEMASSMGQLRTCTHVCKSGLCRYEGCESPQCPGGACVFIKCRNASCNGGACTFRTCSGPRTSCDGGGCRFFDHQESLVLGYCNGENCFYNNRPHPDFIGGYLSH